MGTSPSKYNYFKIESGKMAASGNIMFLMDKTGELKDLSSKDYCYFHMFQNCTSLTKAPVFPATTLASNCYNGMFYGCTSLTQAPALPAMTLAYYCYAYMFEDCTSLSKPKYKMPNLTFDQVAINIQNNSILGNGYFDDSIHVQCSDKILIAISDDETWQWIITEG